MTGTNQQKNQTNKCRDGPRKRVVGEVGQRALGSRCIALSYFAIRLESRKSANKRIYLSNQHNPTVADNNLPATFHLDLFSHFARIHVYVQLRAETQGWVTSGGNFGEKERVNCRQHKLVRWVGEGWGYHVE